MVINKKLKTEKRNKINRIEVFFAFFYVGKEGNFFDRERKAPKRIIIKSIFEEEKK